MWSSIDVVPGCLGAHAAPPNCTASGLAVQLPAGNVPHGADAVQCRPTAAGFSQAPRSSGCRSSTGRSRTSSVLRRQYRVLTASVQLAWLVPMSITLTKTPGGCCVERLGLRSHSLTTGFHRKRTMTSRRTKTEQPHTASSNPRIGHSPVRQRGGSKTGSLLAVGTLVSGILLGVAAIVQSATSGKRGRRR